MGEQEKAEVKDAANTVWWFSKTPWPKADITKVLAPYSVRMKKLLEDPAAFYTSKVRPSGHDIGKGFAKDNGGAIPPNGYDRKTIRKYLLGSSARPIYGPRPAPASKLDPFKG